MKEKLIGLTTAAAAAPTAFLGFGIKDAEPANVCEQLPATQGSHLFLNEKQAAALTDLHLSDLPNETKVVVTLAAIWLVAGGINTWQRDKDYGDEWQKRSDKAVAISSAALGAAIIIAAWT